MAFVKPFRHVNPTLPGFEKSLGRLSSDTRAMVDKAIADLYLDPLPARFDFKKLKGYRNPNVYTITIGGNHAYKMSMEIVNGVAILRRVGTHKEIDRAP